MPAIQLERLKREAATLADQFHQPQAFIKHTRDLYEFYADRTLRTKERGAPPPLLPSYRVPDQLLRHLLSALRVPVEQDPQGAFQLVDELWTQKALEFRLLATRLLGHIPPEPIEAVSQRIEEWCRSNQEETLLESMATDSLRRIRAEQADAYFNLLEQWLAESELRLQKLGLRALLNLVADVGFENLPVAYRLLEPTLSSASSLLRPYVLDVLEPLARRSPPETAYLLRQSLEDKRTASNRWLTRHALDYFPPETQKRLKQVLKPPKA